MEAKYQPSGRDQSKLAWFGHGLSGKLYRIQMEILVVLVGIFSENGKSRLCGLTRPLADIRAIPFTIAMGTF
ncbi:MAG: hypothetical protein ABSH15_04120 [Verrucomicrobiota bacterium]